MDEGLPLSNAQRSIGGQSVPTVCACFCLDFGVMLQVVPYILTIVFM